MKGEDSLKDREFNNKTSIRVVGSSKYGYTVIPNNVMNDISNIGGNSFLVLAKTLQYAHSPEHTITVRGLSKVLPLSVNVISKALNNLIELGYARRRTLYKGNLKSGYEYEVTTKPFDFDSDTDHLFVNNVKSIENTTSSRSHRINDTDRSHDISDHENCDIINKIGKKENKEDEEEASLVKRLLQKYYSEYQLSKKKLPHIKKMIESYSSKFDLDLWEEIFITASDDGVINKYKYIKAFLEDLVKDNIYTLNDYKKRKADQKKSTKKPSNIVSQKDKKDTSSNDNFTNNFAKDTSSGTDNKQFKANYPLNPKIHQGLPTNFLKYTPEELEKLLQESQKGKFD